MIGKWRAPNVWIWKWGWPQYVWIMWMWTIFNPLECKVKSGKCWPLIVWSAYELCWLQFVVCWVVPGPLSTSPVSCSCSSAFLNPIKQNLFCSLSPATTISTHTSYPPHIYTTHRAKHKIKIPSSIRCQHWAQWAHTAHCPPQSRRRHTNIC